MSNKRNTQQRRKKKQSNVSRIISGSQTANSTLASYFEDQTPQQILDNYQKVKNHPYFKNYFKTSKTKKEPSLYSERPIFTTLEKNIYWCIAIVDNNKNNVQFAVDNESALTTDILENSFDTCYDRLDIIAENCGRSMWEIQLRGAIENQTELSKKSDFSITKTIEKLTKNSFSSQLIQKSAVNYDDPETFFISSQTYRHEILRSAHPLIKSFLTYKLFSYDPNFEYDFEKIFNIEKNSSPIDIFFLLLRYFSQQLSKQEFCNDKSEFLKKAILRLSKIISHPVLNNLQGIFADHAAWNIDNELTKLLDDSENPTIPDLSTRINNVNISHIDVQVLEQLAISRKNIGGAENEGLINTVYLIRNILEKNEDESKPLEYFAFDAYRYRSLTWFVGAALFAERESNFVSNEKRENIEKLITIYSPTTKVENLLLLNPSNRADLTQNLKIASSVSEPHYHKIYLFSDLKIPVNCEFNSPIFNALIALKESNHESAITILEGLSQSDDKIIRNKAVRLLVNTLICVNRSEDAVEKIVDSVLSHTAPIGLFDTNKLLETAFEQGKITGKIEYPIIYSLHSRFCDSNFDSELKFLFENFLIKNKKVIPQDLFFSEFVFGKSRLTYFFKWVCTPENMKLYLEFEAQKDIQNSRIAICSYLMENGDSSATIQSEVKEINKANAIKKAAEKVDNSRIYVNTDVFLSRNSSVYRDLFQHYENLSKKDFSDHSDEQNFESIYKIFSNSKDFDGNLKISEIFNTLYFPYIRLNSKNATFLSLFKLIREEFTFGEKGLNNHLSTRIRHGVLPTALRKSVVEESLYIPDTQSEIDFIETARWFNNSKQQEDSNQNSNIYFELKSFSKKFENLISEINDEWLQINTLDLDSPSIDGETDSPKSLFRYSISPIESYALQKELPISPSYNDFIQVTLRWLWEKTESNLELVQNQLNTKAIDRFNLFLDDLKDNLRAVDVSHHQVLEIFNACDRAKQSLRTHIEIICSWFTHIEGDSYEEYDLETAVDIAKKSLNVEVLFINDITCSLLGRALSYTVDIFFILFENAISKSNLDKRKVNIKVSSSISSDKNLVLKISNSFQPSKKLQLIEDELEFYRNAYGDEELIRDIIQKEGGTGFFKIWKILEKDLETRHDFKIRMSEDSEFEVEIILFNSKSIIWNENINS
jgi:hypothetical protein